VKTDRPAQSYLASTFRGLAYAITAILALALSLIAHGEPFTPDYTLLATLAGLLIFPLYRNLDLEPSWKLGQPGSVGTRVMLTWLIVILVLLAVSLLSNLHATLSPSVVGTWGVAAPVMFMLLHILVRHGFTRIFPSIVQPRSAALVFINDAAREFVVALREESEPDFELLGYFEDRTTERVGEPPEGLERIGGIDDIRDHVNARKIDTIFLALPPMRTARTHEIVAELGDTTASIYYVPQLPLIDPSHVRLIDIGGMPVFVLDETPFLGADGMFKRLMDIIASSAALIVAAPAMLVIALAIRLTMGRPIIFSQLRYGLNGEEISVHKFRTMSVTEPGETAIQATRDDPRVTPVGRLLRRTSLDELPQLWNVLSGQMSLVGPRPHAIGHNEAYRKLISHYMTRHKVRPGMTGWAQVHGYRGEIKAPEDIEKRVRYDLEYVRNWSPDLDIKIILRTLWIIFRDPEAY